MSALGHKRKYSIRVQNVRFTPESGHRRKASPGPLSAKRRHMQRSKQHREAAYC
jgi:hypothetical protein